MRHSIFKYFSERKWADAFLDGDVLFRSLSYFRDYEEQEVRGDKYEGTSKFRPAGGLVVNNQTQRTTFILKNFSFQSTVNTDEVLVFCSSRSFTERLRQKFKARACVEILEIKAFCEIVRDALPSGASFFASRVQYYPETEVSNPRWALPEKIAVSKLDQYRWQNEYRLVFCETNALNFEKGSFRLVHDSHLQPKASVRHSSRVVKADGMGKICRLLNL
jgi:hypothetical protein